MQKFMNTVSPDFKSLLIVTAPLTVLTVLIGPVYLLYSSAALLIVIFAVSFGDRFLYGFIIVTLFTLVGDVDETLRAFIHAIDFSLLGYLFLKKHGLRFSDYPKPPKMVISFIILYYISLLIPTLLSDYIFAGFEKIFRQSVFFIIAYILYSLIEDEKDIKVFIISIIIANAILLISSVFLFIQEGNPLIDIATGFRARVTSLIANINATSGFYIISFPLLIVSLMINSESKQKLFHWFLILFFTLGVIITISRSAIVSIIFSTLFIFYYLNRKKFYVFVYLMLFVLLLFVVIEPLSNLGSLLFRLEAGLSQRDYHWKLTWSIINEHPVFGIGPGAYNFEMFNYLPVTLDSWMGRRFVELHDMTGGSNAAHNFFLIFFSDMGILGLITSIALPVIFFRIGFKNIRFYRNLNKENYFLVIGLTAAGASMFIRGMVDGIGLLAYGFITTDLPFWIVFMSLMYFYQVFNDENKNLVAENDS